MLLRGGSLWLGMQSSTWEPLSPRPTLSWALEHAVGADITHPRSLLLLRPHLCLPLREVMGDAKIAGIIPRQQTSQLRGKSSG